jgi:anti-anti-sigma factor
MQCPTHAYADVLVATATGRIDFAGAQVLEGALAPALAPDGPVRGIVIDLAGVDYISSVGLRVLMVAAKAMRARKASIAVASLQPVVAEIFEISRFHHVVDVRGSVRDAIAAVSPGALVAYDRMDRR